LTIHHAPSHAPRHTVDLEAARAHHDHATTTHATPALWHAVADIPVLLAEIDRCRALVAYTRAQHADLLAAARATVTAWHDGEADPLWYLRDELTAHGQLPPLPSPAGTAEAGR
jgi:DNA-binding XRE family transcriptional regulator